MNPLFVGRNRISLDHVNSTNKYLANHDNLTDLPEGSIVLAHSQFEGKGQRNKVWHSVPGKNLTVSVLLRPVFLDALNYFILNKGVTLAVLNTVEHFTKEEVWIKWPNDTMVRNRKIAGILVELNWRSSRCQNAIVGLGLNVNQTEFDNLPNATSLKLLTSMNVPIQEVLEVFCQNLEYQYLQIRKKEWDAIILAYNNRLWEKGEQVTFDHQGETKSGILLGVGNDGKLRMLIDEQEKTFINGEVSINYKFN